MIRSIPSSRWHRLPQLPPARRVPPPASASIEPLEKRVLMHAEGPRVVSVYADNRGEVQIIFNHEMDRSTINTRGIFVHTAGPDDAFGTADDVKINGRVRLRSGDRRAHFIPDEKVPFLANTTYSIKVNAKRVESIDGYKLDGEFNGGGIISGNGVEAGDLLVLSKRAKTNHTARFSTIAGNIDVRLNVAQTPANVSNFLDYANLGQYDNTFLDNVQPGVAWQAGAYAVSAGNAVVGVPVHAPVANEAGATVASRGTISFVRPNDNNPATDDKGTNGFFFNLANNESTLGSQNGGYSEFGTVTGASGLAVMDDLAAFPTINAGTPFSKLPVQEAGTTVEQKNADPQGTLITIRRVAIRNTIVAWV
ncbi:MAG TPA: peptidylprolyl isomerase [Tepidisphaeraceae bacterium]|nr:peptidylprolyl isomerase [Tepidisphaeraceae bacterium]